MVALLSPMFLLSIVALFLDSDRPCLWTSGTPPNTKERVGCKIETDWMYVVIIVHAIYLVISIVSPPHTRPFSLSSHRPHSPSDPWLLSLFVCFSFSLSTSFSSLPSGTSGGASTSTESCASILSCPLWCLSSSRASTLPPSFILLQEGPSTPSW